MARLLGIWGLTILALLIMGTPAAHAQSAPRDPARHDPAIAQAIRDASRTTGVEYEFLLAKAKLESGFDASARASTSSAAGLFQFIEGTWLASVERYRDELGLDLRMGREASETASRAELLELRHDPALAALIAAASTRENAEELRRVLGRRASHSELYMAHFLGSAGAARFMRAWQRNPDMAAATLFPKAARANRSVFFKGSQARSLDAVLAHFDAKISAAIAEAKAAFDDPAMKQEKLGTSVVLQKASAASSPILDVSPRALRAAPTGWTEASPRLIAPSNQAELQPTSTFATRAHGASPQAIEHSAEAPVSGHAADSASLGSVSLLASGFSGQFLSHGPLTKARIAP